MRFATLATVTGLAALSAATVPPFTNPENFNITNGGQHGNGAGPHRHNPLSVRRAAEIAKQLQARQGYGAVTGAGLNWYSSSVYKGGAGNTGYDDPNYYWCFSGPASSFPAFGSWMNFELAFNLAQSVNMNLEESGEIQGEIWNAILSVSAASKVDARLILAVIMQESTGNVYVGCTQNGWNCGLMQANIGSHSYDSSNSQGSINQMVTDGTQGTSGGPGLVQWFNDDNYEYGVPDNSNGNPYNVLRGYNSGNIPDYNQLNNAGSDLSTNAYVSDIANRLQGWTGNDPEGYRARCGW